MPRSGRRAVKDSEKPFEVVGTGTTRSQVSTDSGIAVPGIRIIGNNLDIEVEELQCLLAPDVPWVGLQKAVKF